MYRVPQLLVPLRRAAAAHAASLRSLWLRSVALAGVALCAVSPAMAVYELDWPLGCIPGEDGCRADIGYPDVNEDDTAFDCSAPGYFGHKGVDIRITPSAMQTGIDVLAAADGEVEFVFDGRYDNCHVGSPHPDCQAPSWSEDQPGRSDGYRRCTPLGDYCPSGTGRCFMCFDDGNGVVIRHPDSRDVFATRYGHVKRGSIRVAPGDVVRRGDKIAEVASAGNSTEPHLHFEVLGDHYFDPVEPWAGACGPNLDRPLWRDSPPWAARMSGDARESDNTASDARTVSVGATHAHSIHRPGDVDWSVFTLDVPTTLTLRTRGVLSGDTVLYVHDDPTRTAVHVNDDDPTGGRHSLLSNIALDAGRWYVKVEEYENNGTIESYSLSIEASGAPRRTPTPRSPRAAAGLRPTYEFDAVPDATWYELWVENELSDEHGGSGVAFRKWYDAARAGCPDGSGTCSVVATKDIGGADVEWWVRAWIPGDAAADRAGPWSSPLGYTTGVGPNPPATRPRGPAGGGAGARPTFSWDSRSGASWYWLWVDGDGVRVRHWIRAGDAGCAGSAAGATCSVVSPVEITGESIWWVLTYGEDGETALYGSWSLGTRFEP